MADRMKVAGIVDAPDGRSELVVEIFDPESIQPATDELPQLL
jgi:hypothetical protein